VLLMRDRVYLRCGTCAKVWDIPNRRQVRQPETTDHSTHSTDPEEMLRRLRAENEALRYAALSFGDLAERLNDALRQERERHGITDNGGSTGKDLD